MSADSTGEKGGATLRRVQPHCSEQEQKQLGEFEQVVSNRLSRGMSVAVARVGDCHDGPDYARGNHDWFRLAQVNALFRNHETVGEDENNYC